MIKLTAEQIKLTEQLLITVMKKESCVEYKELGDRVDPVIHHRQVPRHIVAISELCFEFGLPLLSAKVISKTTGVAGAGFYPFYLEYFPQAKKFTPLEVFRNECKKIRECTEWYKLADYLNIDINLPRPNTKIVNEVKLAIRILPMSSKNEFPGMSIEDVQNNYFLGELIHKQKGMYYYKNSGIKAPEGSLILFQFDNMIIAAARLLGVEKYVVPVDGQYYGAYRFDINSVDVFRPITLAEINKIDITITGFSQVKQEIDSQLMNEIHELIKSKQMPISPDELPRKYYGKLTEGAKRQIVVNAYERNYKARQACIEHYGFRCVVCGFDFEKFYGDEFEGIIHVHHVKPLFEIKESYEVDPIKDLRPVCPNCHSALHSKIDGKFYGIYELKAKILIEVQKG
ncbi:HNH endonuclease [Clostridium tagluense]|uniref:HNH endonuclease n=1 Tax=Clostridium tagluense TaxID=360422 RepID=UPI001CF5762B|nr:HNH endonuclease [Clostridium tagluense]MCB2300295.1 HNH endonuclease [Clostridium tagluense]